MLTIDHTNAAQILADFGITSEIKAISELQRYDHEHGEFSSPEEVRLIVKVEFTTGLPVVVRLKNESDVTIGIVGSQSGFADALRENGVPTPQQYQSAGTFARQDTIDGYNVIVTVEEFVDNELKAVDAGIAEKTGVLLARTHDIAERNDLHVDNPVLFDPFVDNDLFDFETFQSLEPAFGGEEKALFQQIVHKYHAYMDILSPLRSRPRYAVQGDISNCNLYQTASGEIGVFDFNRCGDNCLFCDAVMQAVYEAKLMDYASGSDETSILTAFLNGYRSIRDFSAEEEALYPYLRAVINAFWSMDIKWNENSLKNAVRNGDTAQARTWLETIWQRLCSR